eukprot:TRINITY_DN39470_c0_g1_i1.p1 TRINITY_DN39470_c0_g1~~TRINITY_DN39470_c0_g1_i1.p1  ORF type:complete len:841 (+),score=159.60 TRINITY_DN39470_c0_g1_i1:118-2523(+)
MAPPVTRRRVVWQPVADTSARSGRTWAVASTPSTFLASVSAKPPAAADVESRAPVKSTACIAQNPTTPSAASAVPEVSAATPAPPPAKAKALIAVEPTEPAVAEVANRAADEQQPPASKSRSKRGGGSGIVRPGDWTCPCGVNVFASKATCFKCGASREESKGPAVPTTGMGAVHGCNVGVGSSDVRPGDWSCPCCGLNVFASKTACFKCGATKDSVNKGLRPPTRRLRVDTDQSTDASDDRLSGADADNDSETVSSDAHSSKTPREGSETTPREADGPLYGRERMLSIWRSLPREASSPSEHLHTQPRPEEPLERRQEPKIAIVNDDFPASCGTGKSWADMQRQRRQAASEADAQVDDQPVDDAVVARRAKGLLNKLTPEKFDVLCEKLLQCGVRADTAHADMLAKAIFEAVMQQNLGSMYADLCLRVMEHFGDEGYLLRDALLAHCWQAFVPPAEAWQTTESGGASEGDGSPESGTSIVGPSIDTEELEAAAAKRKKRGLGSVRFMGELFVRNLLFPYGIITCLNCLMQVPLASENIELAIALLTVIGPVFDTSAWIHYDELRSMFWSIHGLCFDPAISPRVRCLLRDLLDLRDAGWVDTKRATKKECPKRLEDVRWEAAAEKNGGGNSSAGNISTPRPSPTPRQSPLSSSTNSWTAAGGEQFSSCATEFAPWQQQQNASSGATGEFDLPAANAEYGSGGTPMTPPPNREVEGSNVEVADGCEGCDGCGGCGFDACNGCGGFADGTLCESMWQGEQGYLDCAYMDGDVWYGMAQDPSMWQAPAQAPDGDEQGGDTACCC